MSRDAWLTKPRVAGNDGSAVVALLTEVAPDDGLQLAGQSILRCPSSPELIATAMTLASSLSRRGWRGDAELTAELEHVCNGTDSGLSPLPSNSIISAKRRINRPPTCRTSTSRPVMERFIDTIDNPGLASRLRDDDQPAERLSSLQDRT